MPMPIRNLLAGTAAIALLAGAAVFTPKAAEAQTQAPTQDEQQAPAAEYDDATLQTYAAAMSEVVAIGEEKQPAISEAEDEQEAEELWTEMQEEMVAAVEAQGMDVEEYNQITQQAQTDPDLASRINELVQQQ